MKRIALLIAAWLALGLGAMPARAQDRDAELVNNYYQQYLGRNADPGGLAAWVTQMGVGGPASVQAGILGSDEYYQRRGSSPEGFVAGLYSDVLGRSASPAEIQGWLNVLAQSGSRTDLASQFLNAAQPELGQQGANPPAYAPPVRRYRDWNRGRNWEHDRHHAWERER